MDGYKTLKAGQSVSYEVLGGPKGSHAINISSQENQESEATEEAAESEAVDETQVPDQVSTDSDDLQDSD